MDRENGKQRPFMATLAAKPLWDVWSRVGRKVEACVAEHRRRAKRAEIFHRISDILVIPMWLSLAAAWAAAIIYPGSWLFNASFAVNMGSAFALMICMMVSSLERWGAASERVFYWQLRREEDRLAAKLGITDPPTRETDKEML